jgi:hypothetical protein
MLPTSERPSLDGVSDTAAPSLIGANRMSTATTRPPVASVRLGGISRGLLTEFLCPGVDCEAHAVPPGRFPTGYHDDIGAFTDPFPGDQESLRQAGQYGPMQSRSSRVSRVQSDG